MTDKNSELLARLLVTFRVEAADHVRAMSSGLLALEKLPADGPPQREIIETVFRQAHSLKGAARAVKFSQIESICQPMESIFAAVRDRRLTISTPLADLLHRAFSLIEGLANGSLEQARERQPEVTALVRQLDRTLSRTERGRNAGVLSRSTSHPGTKRPGQADTASVAVTSSDILEPAIPTQAVPREAEKPPDPVQARAMAPSSSTETTVRVSTKKLDAVMRLSEEMLGSRLAATQRADDLRYVLLEVVNWRKRSKKMQNLLRLLEREFVSSSQVTSELRKLRGYFDDEQLRVSALAEQLASISRFADSDCRTLGTLTDDLRERVRDMQLLPCNTLLDQFARQARALAREQDKEVDLRVQGSDIEVDRTLLDEIRDPLIHLMRNCIDHGIEKPAQRQKMNKPRQGTIGISVVQRGSNKISITVTDDGAGIDIPRLKAVAIERGIIVTDAAENISDAEALHLIFHSGLSTSPLITDLSGRGLGMAIVRDKIEQLGGIIEVSSTVNVGTRFELVLPISLATFRGTLVKAADESFIIPSANVERVLRAPLNSVHTVNNCDTVDIGGQALALVWLHDILNLPRRPPVNAEAALTIILGRGVQRVAFRVDSIIGEQEVLVKGLGPQLRRVPNVAGASILGNGQVVPVLNVPDLLAAAHRRPSTLTAAPDEPNARAQPSILVAEDSITSRSLIKNILEAAGFRVVTAVDGVDAYTTLKTQTFDLLVSDVDMPRMNGFDLTTKIRADKELSEMPVILVTTLDSHEDRERGVDAGANAYIVKSSFDQSNLLEVIARLI